ncbi:MAG: M48 family metalloprotease [Hyphomonadaceae bacterium]
MAERDAGRSGERIHSAELESYVRGVSCRVAEEYCGDIRLYLMQRPFFNATMAPNGYMEVWSGLLLRAENEAQLAFIMGHEAGHYIERHSLDAQRAYRARANAALALTVGIALIGVAAAANNPYSAQSIMDATGNLVDIVYLASIASFFGYTRENESEADAVGFQRAAAAGYDKRAPVVLWRNLMEEVANSDFEATRRREARFSIFNSHPLTSERTAALETLQASAGDGGAEAREAHRAAIRPFLDPWLRDELRKRDYGPMLFLIARLERGGEDLGMLSFYRGETYRLRRNEGDLALAQAAYEAAIVHVDTPAAAWRQLGEIYARSQRADEAAGMLRVYLEKAPEASDRFLVERRLAALGGAE